AELIAKVELERMAHRGRDVDRGERTGVDRGEGDPESGEQCKCGQQLNRDQARHGGVPSLQASLLGRVRPHLGSAERVRAGMKATCTENHLSRRSTTIGCESGARADKIVAPARLSRAVRLRLIDRGACPMNPPFAIDIYQGDNVQDTPGPLGGFARVKAMGIAFLLHKATEGVDVIDKRYDARRA